jgi:Na+/H+ antiporter NhaD/arsenite permease-like protein
MPWGSRLVLGFSRGDNFFLVYSGDAHFSTFVRSENGHSLSKTLMKPPLSLLKTKFFPVVTYLLLLLLLPVISLAAGSETLPAVYGIRIEFILFGLTLVGVAIFHKHTMWVALAGLAALLIYKFSFSPDFSLTLHIFGGEGHDGEWRTLLNLLGLLLGFAVLAGHFEESGVPDKLPGILPNDWKGGFILLVMICVMSSFLDNIAAAMLGGAIAMIVFKGKVHVGYLAGIVAASNAGGAGSVVGDTTTTLMWIDGVNPLDVTHAYIGSLVALVIFGVIASIQQDRYQRIQRDPTIGKKVSLLKVLVVFLILAFAILSNYFFSFPAMGVWIAILTGSLFVSTPWHELKKSVKGSIFLLSLVTCASLMPVDELPTASAGSALALGFISAVFDNIPLTKLCLVQGGYDWGILAFTVGFGGSMIWFGSSAGVALSNLYPEAKSVAVYIKKGWHVTLAYIVAFIVMIAVAGWHPHAPHREPRKQQTEIKAAIPGRTDAGEQPLQED